MIQASLRRSQSQVTRWWYASQWFAYIDGALFAGALWPGSPPAVSAWLITSGLLVICVVVTWAALVVRCPACRRSLLALAARQGGVGLGQWLALLTSCEVCEVDRNGEEPLGGRNVGGGFLPSGPKPFYTSDTDSAQNLESDAGALVAAGGGFLLALGSSGLITFLLIQLNWFGEEPAVRSPLAAGLAVGAWIPGAVLGAFAATRLAPRRSGGAALLVAGMLLLTVGLLTVSQAMTLPVWLFVLWAAVVFAAAGVGYATGLPRTKPSRKGE